MFNTSDAAPESRQTLRLLVKGFAGFDARLLDGVVKLSRQRNPVLELVDESAHSAIDVILIDGKNEQALTWAQGQSYWLAQQAVVWVDAPYAVPKGHTALQRPVRWTDLPVILSRAMDDAIHYYTESNSGTPEGAAAPAPQPVPATSAVQSIQVAEAAPEAQLGGTLTTAPAILVVDDSAAVRGHLTSALKIVGYNVDSVDSGEAAIMAINARPYDCILMDVLMPGIDGYETCRKVKAMPANGRHKPSVVMLTSKSSPFDRIRGKMAGCDAYLTKPVQKSHLMQVLAKHAFKV